MARVSRVLARGRAAALSLMTDRWVVRRPTGGTVRVGFRDMRELVTVYDDSDTPGAGGPAYLQTYEGYERAAGAASSASVTVQRAKIHFPIGDYRPQPGDVATCVAAVHDPNQVGMSVQIAQDMPIKASATAYRAFIDDVVGDDVPPLEVPDAGRD